jgi:hypothetical protein
MKENVNSNNTKEESEKSTPEPVNKGEIKRIRKYICTDINYFQEQLETLGIPRFYRKVILESQTNGQLLVILDILKARVERKRLNEMEANSVVVGKEKNTAKKDLLKPDVFDSDFKKFDIFKSTIIKMFKLAHYQDSKKVIIMRSYLSGHAFKWTEDCKVQIEGKIKFKKYLTEFEKNFGRPLKEEYAKAKVKRTLYAV